MVQKRRRVLWDKAHLKWTVSKWKSVLWSDESKFDILVGNHRRHVLRAKAEGDLPACSHRSVQKHLWWYGVHKCIQYGQLACFGRHYECWKVCKDFNATFGILFQEDNVKPHTAAITIAWLHSRRVRVLNWPACSPDISSVENIWCIIKWNIRQRQPQTLQQLETYIRQEWDQITTPQLQKLITSMPRRLQTVLKRRGEATPW